MRKRFGLSVQFSLMVIAAENFVIATNAATWMPVH